MSGSTPPMSRLLLGHVTGAHGLRGEVSVRPLDPDSESLSLIHRVVLRPVGGEEREWALRSVRKTPKGFLVQLDGLSDRTAAESLRGFEVCALREDLPEPDEGEFFEADLIGLEAVTEDGAPLGRIEDVWDTGPVPNLVIRSTSGEELLVPFAEPFVPEVDLEAGRAVIRPPEYAE